MSSQPTRTLTRTPAGSFVEDELVVALPYEQLLQRVLESWGAAPRVDPADHDTRLGLARVRLSAGSAVSHLETEHPGWVQTARAGAVRDGYPPSALDVVTRCLRNHFRSAYAGWVPEFGKNRVVSRLHGSYVIGGGGTGSATAQPDYVVGGAGSGAAKGADGHGGRVARPDYVIGGGGTGAVEPAYVIGGGGVGVEPQYVIGGGGRSPVGGSAVTVPLRRSSPGAGIRVAVVDTSAARHPWLDGGFITPAHELFRPDGGSDPEMVAHGTFVVGLVLRQAPGATVVVREGLDEHASQDSWSLAQIVADVAAERPAVVNLSLGCLTDDNAPPLVLQAAIDALGPDTLVVAAAGNHGTASGGCPPPSWPAALDSVLAVGAVDDEGRPADFSPQAPWVDAVSAGVDVVSTLVPSTPDGPLFASWSGTSFAAAAVSGAIAAAVGPTRGAHAAWKHVASSAARDGDGRPVVPLRPLGKKPS